METSTRGQRSFLKCSECRNRKRKCEPEDRVWEDNGEKQRCRNCLASGGGCGPNVPHPRSSIATATPTTDVSLAAPSNTSSSQHQNPYSTGYSTSSSPPFRSNGSYATPSSSSSFNSRPRGSSRLLEGSGETRGQSPRDFIRARLIDLGNQRDLFYYLQSRLFAVANAQPPGQAQQYDEIYNVITGVVEHSRLKYVHICEQILATLQHALRTDKEVFLRSFEAKLSDFLALSSTLEANIESGEDDFRQVKEIHCTVLCLLAAVCEEAADFSDAHRFRRQLEDLECRYQIQQGGLEVSQPPDVFTQMSTRISDAFRSLNIPSRLTRHLPKADNIFPPAHLAIDAGRQMAAHEIIAGGLCRPEERDILSRQALHIAAESGDGVLLQLALQCRPEASNDKDIFKMTALCIAAYRGNFDVFTALIQSGSDAKAVELTGRSVLCIASGAGHLPIVRYLLQHGYMPNPVGNLGPSGSYSALHAAAAGGYTDIAELLVEKGASALLLFNGLTPAQEAENREHYELATWLSGIEREQADALPNHFATSEQRWHHEVLSQMTADSLISHNTSPQITTSPPSYVQPSQLELQQTPQSRAMSRAFSTTSSSQSSPCSSELNTPSKGPRSTKRTLPTSITSSPTPSESQSQMLSNSAKRRQTTRS